jgi:hypothetical protein
MTNTELLDAIRGRAPKQKDFTAEVDKLVTSKALLDFVENNQILLSAIRPSQVADQLLLAADKFLSGNAPVSIAKNVYNEYSVIYALCMLGATNSKSERNALSKIFFSVLSNTSKFDMYVRKGNRNVRVSSETYTIELFWLIPLFVNVRVLTNLDVEQFIEENEDIKGVEPDYADGYAFFATGDILGVDKSAYKQYISDGVVALSHSRAA